MKTTTWYALMVLFVMTTLAVAQDEPDDEPLPPPRRAGATKIGGAVGFTQGLLFMNFDPINEVMRRENLAEFTNNGLAMFGGQAYGYVLFVPNLRLGYQGMSGSTKSKTYTLASNTTREVELSVGYHAATFDYTIPVVPRLDVSVGMMLGGGSLSMEFTRSSGTGQQWLSTWDEFGSNVPAADYSGKLSSGFFMYQPTFNVEFAILRWLAFRGGVSYLGMAGSDWKRDDRYEVFGVPDNINGKGWMINSGIYIGTFVF
ncbi:MAG TPA: hypothetical protein VL633_07865 [Bacteroidota bacterium]|nr:hypothetical protein [Bacteroidota bacterium]